MDTKSYNIKRVHPADVGGAHATDPGLVNQPTIPLYLPEEDGTGDEILGARWPWVEGIALEHRYYNQAINPSMEYSQQVHNALVEKFGEAVHEGIAQIQEDHATYVDQSLYGLARDASDEVVQFVLGSAKEGAGVLLLNPASAYEPELIQEVNKAFDGRVYEDLTTAVESLRK